jgi:hypothetical protein
MSVTAVPVAASGALLISRHMWVMMGRPCNPNSDLKRLWQVLLPGTAFPQCGDAEGSWPPFREAVAPIAPPAEGGKSRPDEPPYDS